MKPGELTVLMSYLSSLYKPIRDLAKLWIDFSKVSVSAERIAEILEIEPEIEDRPDAIDAPRLRGEIVFDGVSFDYGDGKALHDVSFAVAPGNGWRWWECRSRVHGREPPPAPLRGRGRGDRIDGVDLQHYRRESLRRQIGVVLQRRSCSVPPLETSTAGDASEEIVAAAQAANADEFIRELEDSYDTILGERGVTLSGGQRQRIAIARALVRNAAILILDEPMTGLDVESEAKVREALDRLMTGKTCLTITHDLQSIANADQVVVLEEGRIVDQGTHAELVSRSGRYRELYELNFQQ
jgi:ABC-type multidrug transport system fused ATPase/permease subunit